MTATRTPTVVLLRHGESTFNASQVFTGLLDAGLTDAGAAQLAVAAGLCRAAVQINAIPTIPIVRVICSLLLSGTYVPENPTRPGRATTNTAAG